MLAMTLGEQIKAARLAADLSQAALGRLLKVSRNAVSLWESDTNVPDSKKVRPLAAFLKVSPEDLWKRIGPAHEMTIISDHSGIDEHAARRHASVTVHELDIRAAMGGGNEVLSELPIAEWSIPENVLNSQTLAPASALKIIQALGGSNEPEIPSGARLMIDTSDRRPSPPGYFAIWDGLGLVVKRVEYLLNSDPPTIRISSANPQYQVYERTLDEVSIAGRVMARWASM